MKRVKLTCTLCGFSCCPPASNLTHRGICLDPLPATVPDTCSNCATELGLDYLEPGVPDLMTDHFIENVPQEPKP